MKAIRLGFTGALFIALGGLFLLLILTEIAGNSYDASFPFMGFFSFLVIGLGLYFIVQSGQPETK